MFPRTKYGNLETLDTYIVNIKLIVYFDIKIGFQRKKENVFKILSLSIHKLRHLLLKIVVLRNNYKN